MPADRVAVDQDRAVLLDRRERRAALQAFQQRLGAPVDEPLGQPLVQRIAQLVLDGARPLLPVARGIQPVRAVRDIGPGADVGQPRDQRVDVAVGTFEPGNLVGDPVGRQAVAQSEVLEHGVEEIEVSVGQGLAEIRDLADRPQEAHAVARGHAARGSRCGARGSSGSHGRARRRCASGSAAAAARRANSCSASSEPKSSSALRQCS